VTLDHPYEVHHETLWSQIADRAHVLEFPEIAGIRTRVLRVGAEHAERGTIVMLAGTTGHLEAFTHNIRALSEQYQVLAYDYPGHGYSTLVSGSLEIDDYARHLLALVEHYHLVRPHLCGESLGGWIALKVVPQHPDVFGAVILSAPGGRMIAAEQLAGTQSVSTDAVASPTWDNVKRRLGVVIHDPAAISDELVAVRQAIYAQPGFVESAKAIAALRTPKIRERNAVTDADYERQPRPTLLVWTDHEPSGSPEIGKALADKLPHGRFVLVEGAAHWPQWEEPAQFNDAVLAFLEEVSR
jgi:2-hydroxy-6-oxonona-2,4-dienedioate hydrolase